jgi:hypothetical protein
MNVIVKAGLENRCIKLLQELRGVTVHGGTVDFHYGDAVVDTVFNHFTFCHGSSLPIFNLLFRVLFLFQLTGIPTQVKRDEVMASRDSQQGSQ